VVVPGDEAKPQTEAELETTMAERTKASLEGDSVKIEGSIAAEYVQTDIAGRVQTKAQWLAEYFKPLAALIKTGQFRWDVWEEKDVQIRLFGSTAVVVGRLTLKGTGTSAIPGRGWVASPESSFGPTVLHFTRVWIKRDGKWLLAALHNAVAPELGTI